MTKKEFFEENYLRLLNEAKESLVGLVKGVFDKLNEGDEEETSFLFYEYGISQPIYKEDPNESDFSHTISSAWIDMDDKVGFTVDAFESGYDIDMDDLDMDMVLYLLGEFENVNLK